MLISGHSVENKQTSKVIVEAYLDLEDLKQSKLDGSKKERKTKGGGGGGGATPFNEMESLLGASVPDGAKSNVWPTLPNREQRGYQNSDPGGDHY